MPIYQITIDGTPPTKRLVEAAKPQTARDHVLASLVEVRRVQDMELVNALKECGEVETATASAEPDAVAEEPAEDETLGTTASEEDEGADDKPLYQKMKELSDGETAQ